MFRKYFFLLLLLFTSHCVFSQGRMHNFLLGYDNALFDSHVTSTKAKLLSDSISTILLPDSFAMPFNGEQANISDENGNLLMYTNGCYIVDASGNQMQNGDSLNPGPFTTQWCVIYSDGLPYSAAGIFLPFPGDTSKFILFHQTLNNATNRSSELYYSKVDMQMNGGLGACTSKNNVIFSDQLDVGIAACKHANGRDWWITCFKDNTDSVYVALLNPSGIISVKTQSLNVPIHYDWAGTPLFSPDGQKFAYYYYFGGGSTSQFHNQVRLFDFDRCSGVFSNPQVIENVDSTPGLGISFSANSQYIYRATYDKVYQLNTDTSDILSSQVLVADYDGYCFPYNFTCTEFWDMTRCANGKIYISSGSSTIDLSYISAPDSGGLACNVMQHALRLPCYTFRAQANWPNYYLGPEAGSACDTLAHVGLQEHLVEVQNFTLQPNPVSDGVFQISYLLPQNQSGVFEVYDLNGKRVYSMNLPPWSTLQLIRLPELKGGVYECVVRGGASKQVRKLVYLK